MSTSMSQAISPSCMGGDLTLSQAGWEHLGFSPFSSFNFHDGRWYVAQLSGSAMLLFCCFWFWQLKDVRYFSKCFSCEWNLKPSKCCWERATLSKQLNRKYYSNSTSVLRASALRQPRDSVLWLCPCRDRRGRAKRKINQEKWEKCGDRGGLIQPTWKCLGAHGEAGRLLAFWFVNTWYMVAT